MKLFTPEIGSFLTQLENRISWEGSITQLFRQTQRQAKLEGDIPRRHDTESFHIVTGTSSNTLRNQAMGDPSSAIRSDTPYRTEQSAAAQTFSRHLPSLHQGPSISGRRKPQSFGISIRQKLRWAVGGFQLKPPIHIRLALVKAAIRPLCRARRTFF